MRRTAVCPGARGGIFCCNLHMFNSCARVCMCVFTNICTDARVRKQVLGHRTLLESHVVISGNVILADGVVVLLCLCLQLLLRLLLSSSDSMSGVLMHMHPLIL